MCRMGHITAALLLLIAAHQAAAWSTAADCQDVVVGESNTLGVVDENKIMQKVDHTEQWRKHGQITKLNLYYSWNYGCLQGIKATYGYKAGNALIVGHEKNLYTQDIKLGDNEHVVKAEWRQQPNQCIEFIKVYTDKGHHLTFGNAKSKSLYQVIEAPMGSWLAALKGEHDIETVNGKQVQGGLQNLVFVWAAEDCPATSGNPSQPPVFGNPSQPPVFGNPSQPPVFGNPSQPPQLPESPAGPVAPETPATPDTPEATTPSTPATSEPPAQTASTPPSPELPESPTPVQGPAIPEPETPATPSTPAAPEPPVSPAVPDTPAVPPPVPEMPITPSTPDVPTTPATPEVPSNQVPATPEVPYNQVPVTPVTPQVPYVPVPVMPMPPAMVPPEVTPTCPPLQTMCDTTAEEGSPAFCPIAHPFTFSKCEGGCCVSSGKCKLPLCKLNGLGADVMALDFICYGKNNGPFGGLNKCRNLACQLAVPGCQSGLLGGNCVGTVVAASDNLDEMATQYLGKPCIEVVNHPSPVMHLPLNKPGLPVPNGQYMGGLWTVCDCFAQPSPVLPAIPVFDLKKHLLGKMQPLFAALASGADDSSSCLGPLCALLPQLPVLNASLPDLQIPMCLLANLTALLKPHPLMDMASAAGMIPAIQLPEVKVQVPLTLPDLPTFDDCVSNFVNITSSLKPAIEMVLPQKLSPQDMIHIVSSLLPQIKFELPQLDVSAIPRVPLLDLASLVKHVLPKIPQFAQLAANMPVLKLPGPFSKQQPAA